MEEQNKKRHGQIHQIVKDYEEYRNALAKLDDSINKLVFNHASLLNEKLGETNGQDIKSD